MTLDELMSLLRVMQQRNLTPAQERILRQGWEGKTYTRMAQSSEYECDYLKTTGARLWQSISELLEVQISKDNFRSQIEKLELKPHWKVLIEREMFYPPDLKSLEYPSGPVPLNSPFYINRPPIEELAYAEIAKPGCILRIKAPREMGKTSLMNRILDRGAQLGYATINVDFQQVERSILTDLDKLLRWFSKLVSKGLNLTPQLDEYWDEDIGSKLSCTIYFEAYVLHRIKTPVILAFNEINRIFKYAEVAGEFLPLLRSWHERSQQVKCWQNLRLVVVYSTEVYVDLQLHQSPFNIGMPLKLPEFTRSQVQELARRHGLNWKEGTQAKQLMAIVGGHPALVRLALYHFCRQNLTVKQLLENAHTEAGIYRDRLRRKLAILQRNRELTAAFQQLLTADRPLKLPSIFAYELESIGLVKLEGERVRISCELYRRYFQQQLLVKAPSSSPYLREPTDR